MQNIQQEERNKEKNQSAGRITKIFVKLMIYLWCYPLPVVKLGPCYFNRDVFFVLFSQLSFI